MPTTGLHPFDFTPEFYDSVKFAVRVLNSESLQISSSRDTKRTTGLHDMAVMYTPHEYLLYALNKWGRGRECGGEDC